MKRKIIICISVLVALVAVISVSVVFNGLHQKNAMIEAIKNEDFEGVQRAIDKGAFINFREENFVPKFMLEYANRTPLMIACDVGNEEIVRLLVENGADVNKKDNVVYLTPLDFALNSGKESRFRIAEYLISRGADISEYGSYTGIFFGVLHLNSNDNETTVEDSFRLLKYLLEDCKMTPVLPRGTKNPLTSAARCNNFNAVRYFVENGYFDIDCVDKEKNTALLYVVKDRSKERAEMVELLLELGANVDVTDDQGKTAYDYAVENGHLQIAELLEGID